MGMGIRVGLRSEAGPPGVWRTAASMVPVCGLDDIFLGELGWWVVRGLLLRVVVVVTGEWRSTEYEYLDRLRRQNDNEESF